ncbi:MAG TPA: NUDIX hydrolase [Candidatus Janibacter merdipullorum]|nr:NUDIX hydrolase [Candidatus Janibacter merdipullorum]
MPADDGALRDEIVPSPVTDSEVVFDGAIWDVRRETFDLEGERLVREIIDHPGAVAVLALDEQDRVVLIRQYRHPISSREWEIPAGLLDIAGEDPLVAAQRELAEEADLVAEHWALLVDYFSSPGGMNEALRIYLARGLTPVPEDERHEREGEEAHIVRRTAALDEVVEAVLAGHLHNSTLLVAALAAQRMREGDWTALRPAGSPWPGHPANRSS